MPTVHSDSDPWTALGAATECGGDERTAAVAEGGLVAFRAGRASAGAIEQRVRELLGQCTGSVLVTQADESQRAALSRIDAGSEEHARARCGWIARAVPEPAGTIAIVSAGTSDGPVVHEARIAAGLLGTHTVVHEDAGVAGLHRLAPALGDLRAADCVIAVAGMDAALASVIGGLTPAPVIGVPTSTGYGTAFGGLAALLAMLNSCAAALAVVGIDDGVAAAIIGARIARTAGA